MNVDTVPKLKDVLHSNHENWLHEPTTAASRQIVEWRLNRVINEIATQSLNKDLPDSVIRHYGAQVKILKTIIKDLYDTESFIQTVRTIQSERS